MSFNCTVEGFKSIVAEFCKAAPTANSEQLRAGYKCVGLHYLSITPPPEDRSIERVISVSYLNFASRRHLDRIMELNTK